MKISIKALAHAMSLRPLFICVLIDHFSTSEGHHRPLEDPEYSLTVDDAIQIARRMDALWQASHISEKPREPVLCFAIEREYDRAAEDFIQLLNVLGVEHHPGWVHPAPGYRPKISTGVRS